MVLHVSLSIFAASKHPKPRSCPYSTNDKIISTILPISGELHFSGIAISTSSPGFSHWNTFRTGVNMSQLHLQEAKRLTIPKISQADRLSSMGSHWPTQAPRNPPGVSSDRMSLKNNRFLW